MQVGIGEHYRVSCHRDVQVGIGEHYRVSCHRDLQVGIGEHYRVSCHRNLHSRSALESTITGSDLTAFLLSSDTAVLSHSSKLLLTPFLYFCLLSATLILAFTGIGCCT